jgi:D-arabinose 1-dehydrogenase-like Zn-dependent alcohol dehydrogenase
MKSGRLHIMRVFVTGASGWIGSATVDELLSAGHSVLGLARSDASAAALEERGATVLRGDLDDLDALRKGATDAEGVVHLANKHDWANPAASNAAERGAVEAIAETLVDTERPSCSRPGWPGWPRAARAPRRTRRRSTAPTRRAGGARTSRSSTSAGACAR